jgi:hypothetical protein
MEPWESCFEPSAAGSGPRSEVLALLRDLPTRSTLHLRRSLLAEIIEEVERSKE